MGNLHRKPKLMLVLPPELENCVQELFKNRLSKALPKKTCGFSIPSCLFYFKGKFWEVNITKGVVDRIQEYFPNTQVAEGVL